ncbi:hypothetical protein [Companilactobacillus kimchiensis]|uniref:Uncharacterized protein n=1 Tax=Companilactobacillus kimchiensis TaxID=993692 RepID=A0A0R2LHK0_9LACO|nr:hypothetical protein [Companilactobacillus kimchiensis]KRN99285.1 hypothetical protein IV57_GL000341 [Companilactobacillus kimchiensis]
MNLLKFNRNIVWIGIILLIAGMLIAVISFSNLNFDVSKLVNNSGAWYAPIKWR